MGRYEVVMCSLTAVRPKEQDRLLVAAAAAALLCTTVVIGSGSAPPVVDVGQALQTESGCRVSLIGILVDIWTRESGAATLVLADLSSGATIRAYSTPDGAIPPTAYASMGDELMVTGEFSTEGPYPAIYCAHGDIRLLNDASVVLTLELLCRSYELFLGDVVEVRGSIVMDPEGQAWLTDGCGHSIRLRPEFPSGALIEQEDAIVRAELLLDAPTMVFYLKVLSSTSSG